MQNQCYFGFAAEHEKKIYKTFFEHLHVEKEMDQLRGHDLAVTRVFFELQAPNFGAGQVSVHATSVLFWF